MIALAPIRGDSAEVQFQTASASKQFWELMSSDARSGYHAYPSEINDHIVGMNKAMIAVIFSQERLIKTLATVSDELVQTPEFASVVENLDLIVAQSDAIIRDLASSPEIYAKEWSGNIQRMADLMGHIDNYAESFHIALNENCSALLAHLAESVLSSDNS